MRVLRFQIRHPTGQVDQINVESERVVIGSGAHCEIRLPIDQSRVEHVLIELGPAGVFARALSFEPAPTINNIPFTQAPLPPESVLGVNQMQITNLGTIVADKSNALTVNPTAADPFVNRGTVRVEAGSQLVVSGSNLFQDDASATTIVRGSLPDPLLTPAADERDGYVPNVVYSCGSLLHGRSLVVPYGCSDATTRIAVVDLDALLGALTGTLD